MPRRAGYALIGCGSFGLFCLEQYKELEDVQLLAVADANAELARSVGDKFGITAAPIDQVLARSDIDVVHVATPPATHRDIVLKILKAGKHVLCEKPLATRVADAKAMLDAAAGAKRVLVVNLIMRYDPLNLAVRKIIDERLLGEPIHAFFENYAKDEPLGPQHWFWDPRQSGGIFIEHGVHFFDLFATWLGPGEVLSASQMHRPGNERIIEQVECLCRYGQNVLTSFYHGFHQSTRMDRQEFRIVCERGDIRLFEWLPTTLRIDATLLDSDVEKISLHLPGARVREVTRYDAEDRKAYSRHKHYEVDGLFMIEADCGMPKLALYGKCLRDLLSDQIQFIFDPGHHRILDESAGLTSLSMAERATRMAQ